MSLEDKYKIKRVGINIDGDVYNELKSLSQKRRYLTPNFAGAIIERYMYDYIDELDDLDRREELFLYSEIVNIKDLEKKKNNKGND